MLVVGHYHYLVLIRVKLPLGVDGLGVVHEGSQHRSGEAWLRGPVILSWKDAID